MFLLFLCITVPRGSEVIFMFGEIDCREGIVVSVDKCRYRDFDEGALVAINIFIKVLKQLMEQYDLRPIIHPVVPTLDATRYLRLIVNFVSIRSSPLCLSRHCLFYPTPPLPHAVPL